MNRIIVAAIVLASSAMMPGAVKNRTAAADDAESSGPRQIIHLIERAHDVSFLDLGVPGPSLGDRLVFTSDLFDENGNNVGRDGADCVIVRIDQAAPPAQQQIVQCVVTVQLAGGQMTFQGLAQGTENFFALTGGTGAYRNARGEAFVRDEIPLQVADITITLFR